ncbi:DUF6879 family protein [Kitasatospora sp. NPDC089797]|uniref:DUF6879 family protein n=1 Tax=Kitasatospora sp. NPDC089797 TaxID=3155298 RepID=UPI0034432267
MSQSVPTVADLLRAAKTSAVHLELRDSYGITRESEALRAWRETGTRNVDPESDHWRSWVELIQDATRRGVVVRRARVVSEPVSEYIRYEHAGTSVIVGAGEQVRWMPRRLASSLALPGNDFWLFDGQLVRFNHFTGEGASAAPEYTENPAVAELCASAFEAVWERGTPHADYAV